MVVQLRDRDVIDLASTIDALATYAVAFDEISEADGASYSAADFVAWLRLETRATHDDRDDDTRAAGQRRWRG